MKIISHVSVPKGNELYLKIAKGVLARGHTYEFITESKVIMDFLMANNIDVYNLRVPFAKNEKKYIGMDLESKRKLFSERYSGMDIEYLVRGDAVIGKKSPDEQYTKALGYLDAWMDYFSISKPDLIATSDAVEIPGTTFGELAKMKKIPVMFTNGSSIIPGRMIWDRTMYLNTWLDSSLIEAEAEPSELDAARQYIDRMTRERPFIGFDPQKPISAKSIARSKDYFVNVIFREEQASRYYNPLTSIRTGILPHMRRPVSKGYYRTPEPGDKYVFYPFHVPFDAQITFRGHRFVDQDETVRMIAGALPEKYFLYAKPHPHSVGHYPIKWFKKLGGISNVKLIAPEYNAHALIEKCSAVVTVNSDVGWEALLHGKPVVTLARPFYAGMGFTLDAERIDKLPELLQKALKQPKISEERIEKLVFAAMRSTVEGNYFSRIGEFNCGDENIDNIVDGILKSYERYFS